MDDVRNIRQLPVYRQRRYRILPIVLVTLVVLGFIAAAVLKFWVDYLWFTELHQGGVFTTRLQWSLIVGLAVGLITFLALFCSLAVVRRIARDDFYAPFLNSPRRSTLRGAESDLPDARDQPVLSARALKPIALGVAVLGGLLGGLTAGSQWVTVLAFIGRSSFHMTDPLFHHDLSFYVFTVPFLEMISATISSIIVTTAVVTALAYLATGVIRYTPATRISKPAALHLALFGSLLLALQALTFRIYAWNLVHSAHGIAVGAGFTDRNARLPGSFIMLIASLAAAVCVFVFARRSQWRRVTIALVSWVALAIIVMGIVPALVQSVLVTPNELTRERPVLSGNIRLTQYGYGLTNVADRSFVDEASLTPKDFAANAATTSNIRIWSPSVLKQTLAQLQEFRSYYAFGDVDVDRYLFGTDKYRQVMLSARELDITLLKSPTWVTQHLKYTHGYGVVGAWPDRATAQGRPELFLRDIPPVPVDQTTLNVKRPEIYYGEQPDNYVVAGSTERELDYPSGDNNTYTSYKGTGGIPVSSLLRRIAFALKFQDRQLLFTGSLKKTSRLMFRRNITGRVHELAPFLKIDSDPYVMVRKDGTVAWIVDAYTTSDALPYSDHSILPNGSSLNYVRNSVKAVVDAYDGSVKLYDVSGGNDPILKTWRHIFPHLFVDGKTMPSEITAHLRFPEDLFNLQTAKWLTYHMGEVSKSGKVSADSVQNFYQNEDEWEIPDVGNTGQPIASFYLLAKIPGGDAEEMLLVRPIVPRGKKNLIAYMGARMDPGHYGEIFNLKLSKQSLTQGPQQVSARIRQENEIATQVTLWTKGGTQPLFGDLLVLPIDQSLLYVQPVYLESQEAQLPEFEKVVLVLGDTVAWGNNFQDALTNLLTKRGLAAGGAGGAGTDTTGATGVGTGTDTGAATSAGTGAAGATSATGGKLSEAELKALVTQITDAYNKSLACQKAGDWTCYGEQTKLVGQLLEQATPGNGVAGASATTQPATGSVANRNSK